MKVRPRSQPSLHAILVVKPTVFHASLFSMFLKKLLLGSLLTLYQILRVPESLELNHAFLAEFET